MLSVPRAEFTDIFGGMLHTPGIFSHAPVTQPALQTATHIGCVAHFTAICVVLGGRKLSFFHVYIMKKGMTKKIRKEMDIGFFPPLPEVSSPCFCLASCGALTKKTLPSQRNSILYQKKQPTKPIIFRCSN